MSKGVFITGTDTDVGKTYVTGLILKIIRERSIDAIYYKSALSGGEYNQDKEELIPMDAKYVCEVAGVEEEFKNIVSYTLKTPVSPHLACEMEGVEISLHKIKRDVEELKKKYDFIICEGSGGLICPLYKDKEDYLMLTDVIKEVNYPIVIVARSSLGTINHTVLTVEFAKAQGLDMRGIILNGYNPKDLVHRNNKETIEALTGIKIIGTLENNIDKLDERTIDIIME